MLEKGQSLTINLYCPLLRKILSLVVREEQQLDLGFIASGFGFDPSTLKLNSHFISRGSDFVSSSVTWRSLLSFFLSKGLSTGKDHSDALIVDGKLCKIGTKRMLETDIAFNGILGTPKLEDICMLTNKRLRKSDSEGPLVSECHVQGLKRKQTFGSVSMLKKLKIDRTNSDIQEPANSLNSGISSTCSSSFYVNENLKRKRKNEVIVAAPPCKKIL